MATFVKVADEGSLSAAALQLRISTTMVGKHLRSLEERVGARLLNRTTRRQNLTEAGVVYLERCRRLLASVDEADASVHDLRQTARGVLRITSPVTYGVTSLVPVLADYLSLHPAVSIELTLNDRAADMVEEGYEAAIRIGKLGDSSLIACPLLPYRAVICASEAYLKRKGNPKVPADLARHNCLGYMYWDRRSRWRLIGKEGESTVRVSGNFTANNGQALRAAAISGVGIVMQPQALFEEDIAKGRLVRVLPRHRPPERAVHLVYLPDRHPSPRLRSFIDFVVERLGRSSSAKIT